MKKLKKILSDFKRLDIILIFSMIFVTLFGILNIRIATNMNYGNHYVKLQLAFLGVAIIGSIVIFTLNLDRVMKLIPYFYWFVNILLIFVLFTKSINGASGWFNLGVISIQPAELEKISVLLMICKILQERKGRINSPKVFLEVAFYALLPMVLMMLQPEMGITMITFFMVASVLFIAGLNLRVIISGFLIVILAVISALRTNLVPEHWKNRIFAFLSGATDELNVDYQLNTAKISIGSGQLFGSSNPGYYNWIPENHTDFIFAVLCENYGFLGATLLILAFIIILWRILVISRKAQTIFGRCLCIGVFAIILFSILQNIGMTIGMMPIAGITLPFVSYGGSSLLTNYFAVALVLNIGMRKRKFLF